MESFIAHVSEASCVITVDLAGRSDTNNNVYIRKRYAIFQSMPKLNG